MINKYMGNDTQVMTGRLTKTIVLIGMMGVGKSRVGLELAHHIGSHFVDTDHEIEKTIGLSVAQIFAQHGEAYFREAEKRVITDLLQSSPMILAIGGGAFMNQSIRYAIAESAVSIWLTVNEEALIQRLNRSSKKRPLLQKGDHSAIVRDLIKIRHPVYAKADIRIENDKITVQEIAQNLGQLLEKRDIMIWEEKN